MDELWHKYKLVNKFKSQKVKVQGHGVTECGAKTTV